MSSRPQLESYSDTCTHTHTLVWAKLNKHRFVRYKTAVCEVQNRKIGAGCFIKAGGRPKPHGFPIATSGFPWVTWGPSRWWEASCGGGPRGPTFGWSSVLPTWGLAETGSKGCWLRMAHCCSMRQVGAGMKQQWAWSLDVIGRSASNCHYDYLHLWWLIVTCNMCLLYAQGTPMYSPICFQGLQDDSELRLDFGPCRQPHFSYHNFPARHATADRGGTDGHIFDLATWRTGRVIPTEPWNHG